MLNEPDDAIGETTAAVLSPRIGIGSLSLRRPAEVTGAAMADAPAAAPTATRPTEGGKGGDGSAPSSPPSNATFLAAVVRGVPQGASAAVVSMSGDPDGQGWNALAAGDVDAQCPPQSNNYFNCSSFFMDEAGDVQARKDNFAAFHALVLDDVGTKVDRSLLQGVTPTWEIETSPGNSQVGFSLAEPLQDRAAAERLQNAAIAAGLCDKGAKGAARWMRLPNAINGKAKHRGSNGQPFVCRTVMWSPDVTYTLDQLVALLGLTLDPIAPVSIKPMAAAQTAGSANLSVAIGNDVWTPAPAENPVITALRERGLLKREVSPGVYDVTCPWSSEHTDGLDTGAAYFAPDADRPIGGFKCHHSHGDRYRIGQLIEFLGVKGDQARGRARIIVVPGELTRVRRAAEMSLAARGGYYQVGGAIVTVRTDPLSGDVSTELLGEAALAAHLSDAADWYKVDGRGDVRQLVRIDPAPRNVQSLLRAQSYDILPPLHGLARQPFFREGSKELVSASGYDPTSGRFAAFDATSFDLPEPSEAAAREALSTLNGLLDEFRFATQADRAAALSAMLTAAVRSSLPTAPAFNITASAPGSGKSYLASTIVPLAGPGRAPRVGYPATAEEATKSMLSVLATAPAAVVFDDMQRDWMPFGAMNSMLTSETITDRKLGGNSTMTVGTRTLFVGTGNNVGPVRDMARRVVTIRIHHKVASPALVKYSGSPAETVAHDRTRYVSAALTVVAAWIAAGSPRADVPDIASYGAWSDLCRQPLIWLGQPDPASSLIVQLEHDPDLDGLRTLLTAWHGAIGDRPVAIRTLIAESAQDGDLQDALAELPVNERGEINRDKLGWYCRRNMNRVAGGFELQRVEHSSRPHWRVVPVEPESDEAG